MKKLLASAATLLIAFGSVALSTNIATAEEAPVVDVVTETTVVDDTAPTAVEEEPATTQEEPPATVEEPPATQEQPAAEQVAEAVATEVPAAPEVTTGTDPPAEPASFAAAPEVETLDAVFVGEIGVLVPWTPESNNPDYWEDYTDHEMQCYKHEGNSDHGYISDGGKTVTLYPFNQNWWGDHWELLVVKGGNVWNNVIVHPTAGVAYASPLNAAGQQSNVSHWIVCKGETPDEPPVASAAVEVKPATCDADGFVVGVNAVNATFGEPTYENGQYTIVATATGDAKFAAGDGVSPDGTTKTFTGPYDPQLGDEDCLASASVQVEPATCEADGFVVGVNAVNATFGEPTYENGQYTIVATATGDAKFAAGDGVSPDGTTKTFTGPYDPQLGDEDCLASASVQVKPATCLADGSVVGIDAVNATFGEPTYENGQYTIVATATGDAKFAAGDGVSPDGTTKTFTGPYDPQLVGEECDLPTFDIVEPTISFTQPTCTANGTYTLGGPDVQWSLNGQPIANGTYSLASGVEIQLTVAPKPPHGFVLEQQTSWTVSFSAPTGPCGLPGQPGQPGQLPTLAMTGGGVDHTAPIAIAGFAVLLGLAAVHRARRTRTVR